jgi:hypothetical protein
MSLTFMSAPLGDDHIWILQFEPAVSPDANEVETLIADPAAFLNARREVAQPGSRAIELNARLPTDLLITYDLDESNRWFVMGVHNTNRISIRAPRSLARDADKRLALSVRTLDVHDPRLFIRLIDGEGIAFAHFDPLVDENERFLKNCAALVADPAALLRFLEDRDSGVFIRVTDANGSEITTPTAVPVRMRYTLSPSVQIHLADGPATQGVPGPDPAEQNCVKKQGNYHLENDENGNLVGVFEITEIFRAAYTPPPP